MTLQPDTPAPAPLVQQIPVSPAEASTASKELWRSEELLGDRREILIQHGNEIYRLRRTRQGKLILHK